MSLKNYNAQNLTNKEQEEAEVKALIANLLNIWLIKDFFYNLFN